MRITCDTLTDARLATAAARTVCRDASKTHGHDMESCPCPVCQSIRLLAQAIGLLGEVSTTDANRVY